MAGLQPYAQLRTLRTNTALGLPGNTVVAATSNIVDWSFTFNLDKAGSLLVEVGAGDPGNADPSAGTWRGFADAILLACADFGRPPEPLLLEFSLDDGVLFDSRKLVEQPVRTLQTSHRTVREEGNDLGAILATQPIERVTYTDCQLQDVLGAAPGTIVPIAASGFLGLGGAIPYLAGILYPKPGLASWVDAARTRLRFTAVVNPAVAGTASNVDSDSVSTLAAIETIVNRLAGTSPAQTYGHFVLDPSDVGLNLSGSTAWTPASPAPCSPSLVVGNAGTSPHLVFQAEDNADVDETTTARIHRDGTTLTSDDTALFPAANFIGGKSNAGWPTDGKITGLACINTQIAEGGGMSGHRDQWTDCLPLIGIDVNGKSGGVYFSLLDGEIRPIPGSPNAPCTALSYDQGAYEGIWVGTWSVTSVFNTGDAVTYSGQQYYAIAPSLGQQPDTSPASWRVRAHTRTPSLLMGTPQGIYILTQNNFLAFGLPWVALGNLGLPVARIQTEVIPTGQTDAGSLAVFALVKGAKNNLDGIYRCTTATPTWKKFINAGGIDDFVTTDWNTVWVLFHANGTTVSRFHGGQDQASPHDGFTIPAEGGAISSLQRAITVAYTGPPGPSVVAQDSIWALVVGASSGGHTVPAYYLARSDPDDWALPWYDANADGSMTSPGGYPLQLNRVVGLGLSFEGVNVTVFGGTNSGLWYSKKALGDAGGLAWTSCNDQGGLGVFNVQNLAAGDFQYVLGNETTTPAGTKVHRLFIAAEDDLVYSNSSARWWNTIKGRDRSVAGVHLSRITVDVTDDLPSNALRTWGSYNADGSEMRHSPLKNPDNSPYDDRTHLWVDPAKVHAQDVVPAGYFFERFLDGHLDWQYRFVSQTCPWPGQQMSQLPELQSNLAVVPDRSSAAVMTTAKRWLRQMADPQTTIQLESSFSTTDAALRSLRPTHMVHLHGQVRVRDVSALGAVTNTRIMDLSDTPFFVLSHTVKRGTGNTASTTTVLGTVLRTSVVSEGDIASALQDQIHAQRIAR